MIKEFFKRLFCSHEYQHIENYVLEGTNKIVLKTFRCNKCKKEKYESCWGKP